jgi:hypothetical protein
MRIDAQADSPLPLTLERALTALIQGRNAIERARREVADAIEIFSRLQEDTQGNRGDRADLLLRLRRALERLDASHRQLHGSGEMKEPTVPVTAITQRR